MKDWIKLDTSELNRQEESNVHGVAITVGLAPCDVPDAVRGYYDRDIDRYVIEFNYLDEGDEPRIASWQSDLLTLYVGEHTGCIYEIHVDAKSLGADAVRLKVQIKKAMDGLATTDRYAAQRRHYELAKEAISRHADELLEGVH